MNAFLGLCFLFFIGSCCGWALELFFRKFFSKTNKGHKWINPGFLVGPYLPLYGFGTCLLYVMAGIEIPGIDNSIAYEVCLFILMAIMMTVIEYIAGLIFIKGMKVKLWDYTDEWGNLQGIICPKFSLFWAILGAGFYFGVYPFLEDAITWLAANLAFSFFVGAFFGVFAIDVAYSCQLLAKIRAFASDNDIIVKYQDLKNNIRVSREEAEEKARFFLSLYSSRPISQHLSEYKDRLDYEIEKKIQDLKEKL